MLKHRSHNVSIGHDGNFFGVGGKYRIGDFTNKGTSVFVKDFDVVVVLVGYIKLRGIGRDVE